MKTLLYNLLLTCSIGLFFFACLEDETDDFTSERFYPEFEEEDTMSVVVEEPTTPPEDTMATAPPQPCWDSTLVVIRSEPFISLFTRFGGGWTGGDATYSIELPDNRTLWMFGDTFLGEVNPDRSRSGSPFARNSFVIQEGNDLTTFVQSDGSAFVSPSTEGWWYWPTDGTVHNDTLQVLLSAFRSTGEGGIFSFEYASIDLALFTLPDLELISIEQRIIDPTIAFGSCVVEDEDYIYIYGAERSGLNKFANVARAADGDIRNEWEYFNGSEWVSDISESLGVVNDVSEQFAVFKEGEKFYLVTHHHIFGKEIFMWDAPSPEGPWGNQRTIYCTPESEGDRWTYNSFVHPQFTENGEILISYNINSFNFGDLFRNADYYRPYFIRVGNWQ
ncbi:MAG: DUF5005 domain-containing protein [Cyclobacteriaceae bacterium]